MISQQHIEEGLSRAYVQAVGARAGVNISTALFDYGVDGTFSKVINRPQRIVEEGFKLDYQLKATTRWQLENEHVIYDVPAKTYNDLAMRPAGSVFPLLLLVVCLPTDAAQWLECTEQQLLLRGGCYWAFGSGKVTNNVSTVRLRMLRRQQFTPASLMGLMERGEKGQLV